MNIILFGGSFNPPHLGHQLVISQAFEFIENIDELWLMPDYQHSPVGDKKLAPANHRLEMTKSLLNGQVKLQTCCIDNQMSGNTIDHITYLEKQYPQHDFSFLLGSDNLATFDQWPGYQTLLSKMPFYIYPRAGFPLEPLQINMQPVQHPLQIVTNISSTMVRNRLQQKLSIKHLVPEKIEEYIQTHRLYL